MSDDSITVKTRFPGDDEPHATTEIELADELIITLEDCIPTEELEALADEWRENGEVYELQHPDPVAERGRGMQGCANELEALIEEYTDE